jgi:hypothetical protein
MIDCDVVKDLKFATYNRLDEETLRRNNLEDRLRSVVPNLPLLAAADLAQLSSEAL